LRKLITLLLSTSLLVGCTSSLEPEETTEPTATQTAEAEQTQTPEPPPTFELSTARVDSELCKFQDETVDGKNRKPWDSFTYFPNLQVNPYFLPNTGQIEVALVFLDWDDKPGTDSDTSYYISQAELMRTWFEAVSQENLKINWRIGSGWNKLSGSWKDYLRLDNDTYGNNERSSWEQWLLDEAVDASDSAFDYAGVDYVVYAMPLSGQITESDNGPVYGPETVMTSGVQGMAYDANPQSSRGTVIRSDEASIANWVISGTSFQDTQNRSPSWVHWAHEMGHMLGYISHAGVPNPPSSDTYYQNTLYGVDLFADQWQVTRVVATWTAWLAGWLEDDQVWCVNADDLEDEIFAINSFRDGDGSTKSLILRTGETTGLVIESRQWNPTWDYVTPLSEVGAYDGVVMYTIDSARPIGDESLVAQVPVTTAEQFDPGKWPQTAQVFTDIYFHEGQALNFGGLKIEVLSVQHGVDYVRVTRTQD